MDRFDHRPLIIVGAGYVGLVSAVGLANLGHRVELVETGAVRLAALREGRIPIHEMGLQEGFDEARARGRLTVADDIRADAGIIMICVGTPIGEDGRSDLSQLDSSLAAIRGRLAPDSILVIRSTLPIGGTRSSVEASGLPTSRIFTNPEFLRQGTAVADFAHPSRIVVGRFADADPEALAAVIGLYDAVEGRRLVVDIEAAEIIKNGANAFLALKLSFTNEIASLCEEAGADVDEVLDGIGADPRIGRTYMAPSFGFGGSCLPKELTTLALAGGNLGLPMHVTTAASAANLAAQDRFARRVADAVGGAKGRTIALLGLAFKAGTDDIRDSPAIRLATSLLAEGATIRAFDPAAGRNAAARVPGLDVVDEPALAVTGADVVVIATEWPEFRDLPWAAWLHSGAPRLVIDGRRLLDAAALRAAGYQVIQLGDGRRTQADPSTTAASGAPPVPAAARNAP